jgi:hypothetical protein
MPEKANGPDAHAKCQNPRASHYPLSPAVSAADVGLKPSGGPSPDSLYGALRLLAFFGLAFLIMPAAARFGGRDWGRSGLRYYGGLLSGLFLWLLSGAAIFLLT